MKFVYIYIYPLSFYVVKLLLYLTGLQNVMELYQKFASVKRHELFGLLT